MALALTLSMVSFANRQHMVMKKCHSEAKESQLKGQERKDFMKKCLSDGRKAQQEKMKTCNADAKGKKGEERKSFMKSCLSGQAPAAATTAPVAPAPTPAPTEAPAAAPAN